MKNLPIGTKFIYNEKLYMKLKDREKFIICVELDTGLIKTLPDHIINFEIVDVEFDIHKKLSIEDIPTGTYFKIYPNSEYLFIKIDCCLLPNHNAINVCTGEVIYLFPDREVHFFSKSEIRKKCLESKKTQ